MHSSSTSLSQGLRHCVDRFLWTCLSSSSLRSMNGHHRNRRDYFQQHDDFNQRNVHFVPSLKLVSGWTFTLHTISCIIVTGTLLLSLNPCMLQLQWKRYRHHPYTGYQQRIHHRSHDDASAVTPTFICLISDEYSSIYSWILQLLIWSCAWHQKIRKSIWRLRQERDSFYPYFQDNILPHRRFVSTLPSHL